MPDSYDSLVGQVLDAAIDWYCKGGNGDYAERLQHKVMELMDHPDYPQAEDSQSPAADERDEYPLIWVERTWRDVRDGDTVRMPGQPSTERMVHTAVSQDWHVDPRSRWRKWKDMDIFNPIPAEHTIVYVLFDGAARAYEMDPGAAVEIQIERSIMDIAMPDGSQFRWEDRIGTRVQP